MAIYILLSHYEFFWIIFLINLNGKFSSFSLYIEPTKCFIYEMTEITRMRKTRKYEENLYVPENDDFEIRASHSFNHGRRIQVTSSLQNSAIYLRRNMI